MGDSKRQVVQDSFEASLESDDSDIGIPVNGTNSNSYSETRPRTNHKPYVIRPKRKIVVEPVLVMMALVGFPMSILSQQYIYTMMCEEVARDHGLINVTQCNQTDNYCSANKSDPDYILQQEVQQRSSQFNIYMTLAVSLPSVFVAVFLGAYSDKAGRKFAILPPIIGSLLRVTAYLLVLLLELPLWVLIVGSFIDGCFGYFTAILMGCFAYIADITDKDERQFRIVVVELIMFISGIFGPIGLGYWIEENGYLWPFVFITAGLLLNIFYIIFFVPETIQKQSDARFFDTAHIKKTIKLFTKDDGTDRRWQLCILLASFFVVATIMMETSVTTLFEMNSPLCWTSVTIGIFSSVYIAVACIGGILSAKILKCFLSDHILALLAGIMAVVFSVYRGFVSNTVMMFCGVIFAPLTVLYIPTTRAIMSKLVAEDEQGTLFGAIAFTEVICNLVGGVTVNAVYEATTSIMTSFVFFYMAIVYAIGTIIYGVYIVKLKEKKNGYVLLRKDYEEIEGSQNTPQI